MFCGEEIASDAGRCPFCSSILDVRVDNLQPGEGAPSSFDYPSASPEPAEPSQNPPDTGGEEGEIMTQPGEETVQACSREDEPVKPEYGQNPVQMPPAVSSENALHPGSQGAPAAISRKPLSNGIKVLITVLCTLVPGIGQLAGVIAAIIFMNSDGDSDRKSFGLALLVASLALFVLSCISCFIILVAFSVNNAG